MGLTSSSIHRTPRISLFQKARDKGQWHARTVLPLALMALACIAGCVRLPDPPPPALSGPVFLFLADKHPITFSEFGAMASQFKYFLVGENHANPCDHEFQRDMLAALTLAGISPGVGLEMVAWDRQDVLDSYNLGSLALDQLEERLDWRNNWGYPFDLYHSVLEKAQSLGFPLVALNTPKDMQSRISADGLAGIPEQDRGLLPPDIIPPTREHMDILKKEQLRHVRMMHVMGHEEAFDLDRFVLTQSLWDTQMAHIASIWQSATGRPMVILAGVGHVEGRHGIAHRLRVMNDDPEIFSVVPWRGGSQPDASVADAFFYCPASPQPRLGMRIQWLENRAVIVEVVSDSRAAAAGLKPGDTLLTANDLPVTALSDLHEAGKNAFQEKEPLRLKILRDAATIQLTIPHSP